MSLAVDRAGKMKFSSMVLLLLLVAAVYYGYAFGSVYVRRWSVGEAVDGQLAYAGQLADETIREQLADKIASMNVPPAARRIRLVRTAARTLQVSIAYTDTVNLLYGHKNIPVSVTRRRTY